MLKVLVLLCLIADVPDFSNCDKSNAAEIMVVTTKDISSAEVCGMQGQFVFAQTTYWRGLRNSVGEGFHTKIRCEQSDAMLRRSRVKYNRAQNE